MFVRVPVIAMSLSMLASLAAAATQEMNIGGSC